MTPEVIKIISNRIASDSRQIYGDKLVSVILYGSCARGDYTEDSDIDIMVLLNIPPEDVTKEMLKLSPTASELDLEYETLTIPTCQSISVFNKWKDTLPFYQNIEREGIVIG